MEGRRARICLLLGSGLFLTGGLMLCHCPGWYVAAAGFCLPAWFGGTPMVRSLASILFVLSVFAAAVEFRAEGRLENRLKEIRAPH